MAQSRTFDPARPRRVDEGVEPTAGYAGYPERMAEGIVSSPHFSPLLDEPHAVIVAVLAVGSSTGADARTGAETTRASQAPSLSVRGIMARSRPNIGTTVLTSSPFHSTGADGAAAIDPVPYES